MTQQPFSRPGAIDLSALKKPAPAAPSSGGQASSAGGGGGSAYSLTVTEENFQQVIESSMTAPVLLAFYSASRLPESEQMARDLASAVDAHEGRFLAALADVDAPPAIAQAVAEAGVRLEDLDAVAVTSVPGAGCHLMPASYWLPVCGR